MPGNEEADGFDIVHADLLRGFAELAESLDGDPDALLAAAGLSRASLEAGTARFGYRQLVLLLEQAALALACPDLGLRLAAYQGGPRVWGPLGAVFGNSRTLGEALDYTRAHAFAHSPAARIRISRDGESGAAFVAHALLVDGLPCRAQAVEQILLLGHLNALEITGGRARVRAVHFRHRRISPAATYRRHFGCDVRFGQQEDGVVFAAADLAAPITAPDADAYRAATAYIDTCFDGIRSPFHAQVHGVVSQLIGTERCSNEQVAAELNLHPRTLHRRLRAEGKSFQAIKDAVRRDAALYYLRETDLDLTRIAGRLGYAEHSVFTRSCVRWFAAAPSRLRDRALAMPAHFVGKGQARATRSG